MSIKLLSEHHLEFLSLKGGCAGSSECTHVKIPHCWKSHVEAHMKFAVRRLKYVVSSVILIELDQVKRKLLKLKVKCMLLYLSIYLLLLTCSIWNIIIPESDIQSDIS